MIHFMLSAIIVVVFFAIFGEAILMFLIGLAVLAILGLVGWSVYNFSIDNPVIFVYIFLVIIILIPSYFLTREIFREFKNKSSNSLNTTQRKRTTQIHKFSNLELLNDFRARYPFVMVDVPLELRENFINECSWLQDRIGKFPSESDQIAILKSLNGHHSN